MKTKLKNVRFKSAKEIFTSYSLYIAILLWINVLITINSYGFGLKNMGLFIFVFGFCANLVGGLLMLLGALLTTQRRSDNWGDFFDQQKGKWSSFGKKQKKEWSSFLDRNMK